MRIWRIEHLEILSVTVVGVKNIPKKYLTQIYVLEMLCDHNVRTDTLFSLIENRNAPQHDYKWIYNKCRLFNNYSLVSYVLSTTEQEETCISDQYNNSNIDIEISFFI